MPLVQALSERRCFQPSRRRIYLPRCVREQEFSNFPAESAGSLAVLPQLFPHEVFGNESEML